MADLLRIPKQDKLFKKLYWACLAVSHDYSDLKPALKLLHVEKHNGRLRFTGCDGDRFHRFTTDIDSQKMVAIANFKDVDYCLYAISKITKSELTIYKSDCEAPYPDIDSNIPKNNNCTKGITFTYAFDGISIHTLYAATIRSLEPEWALNATLFTELLSGVISKEEITIKIFSMSSSAYVMLEAEYLTGLLMPIKIKNKDLIIEDHEDSGDVIDGADLLD